MHDRWSLDQAAHQKLDRGSTEPKSLCNDRLGSPLAPDLKVREPVAGLLGARDQLIQVRTHAADSPEIGPEEHYRLHGLVGHFSNACTGYGARSAESFGVDLVEPGGDEIGNPVVATLRQKPASARTRPPREIGITIAQGFNARDEFVDVHRATEARPGLCDQPFLVRDIVHDNGKSQREILYGLGWRRDIE